ncbi:MAG: response regulator transcription factor [Planctomycetia bacterium]|nr:response regulator transcription factor [Planctomycetia bacterium]
MPLSARIRLLLVDDHPVMRAGLANLLSLEKDFQVVAQADDGEAALRLWHQHRPDVCLLDVTMHGIDGIETLRRLKAVAPAARVLMLTSSEAPEDMAQSLKAGAAGYLTKNVQHDELVQAIRSVHAGGKAIDPCMVDSQPTTSGGSLLTPRELEVLGLMREGFTNTELGRLIGTSTRTAKAHVAAIIEKLQVIDRTQAVARGFDLGLLKTAPVRPMTRRP